MKNVFNTISFAIVSGLALLAVCSVFDMTFSYKAILVPMGVGIGIIVSAMIRRVSDGKPVSKVAYACLVLGAIFSGIAIWAMETNRDPLTGESMEEMGPLILLCIHLPIVGTSMVGAVVFAIRGGRLGKTNTLVCLACGYDLRGSQSECPECGTRD